MLLEEWILWVLLGIIVVWVGGLTFWLFETLKHYNNLTRGVTGQDLQKILEQVLEKQEKTFLDIKKVSQDLANLEKSTQTHIQKVAVVRFNPYPETGGNQSFALAMLNKEDTGIVLLSLHGREGTRFYVKPISKGKSQYDLSREEQQVLAMAKKGK